MIALGPLLIVFGIGFFCWLLFTFAVYALPCFACASAGLAAFHSGAGVIGGIVVGFFAGAATLYTGQFALPAARSSLIRTTNRASFRRPLDVRRLPYDARPHAIRRPIRGMAPDFRDCRRGARWRDCLDAHVRPRPVRGG